MGWALAWVATVAVTSVVSYIGAKRAWRDGYRAGSESGYRAGLADGARNHLRWLTVHKP